MIEFTDRGIYCVPGDFYIDASKPVSYNIVTHAHADHARPGHRRYLAHVDSVPILKLRLGDQISVEGLPFGSVLVRNGVRVSFHPAGHILGSAQVRMEHKGEVCVVSGDYKAAPDPLGGNFEPVPCHTFVTECTFAMPVYSWPAPQKVFDDINRWWRQNRDDGKTSLLCGYALGKAQRLLWHLDTDIGPVHCHGAVWNVNEAMRRHGISLPPAARFDHQKDRDRLPGSLILAPPSALNSPWAGKIKNKSTGLASGWMQLRGARRRRAVDRGFVLSDHGDWNELNQCIEDTGAETVICTHGYTAVLSRWLDENGYEAHDVQRLLPDPPADQDPSA